MIEKRFKYKVNGKSFLFIDSLKDFETNQIADVTRVANNLSLRNAQLRELNKSLILVSDCAMDILNNECKDGYFVEVLNELQDLLKENTQLKQQNKQLDARNEYLEKVMYAIERYADNCTDITNAIDAVKRRIKNGGI